MVASVEPQTNVLTNTEVSPVLLYSFHYKPNSILKLPYIYFLFSCLKFLLMNFHKVYQRNLDTEKRLYIEKHTHSNLNDQFTTICL